MRSSHRRALSRVVKVGSCLVDLAVPDGQLATYLSGGEVEPAFRAVVDGRGRSGTKPIAVIGVGCRFPGGVQGRMRCGTSSLRANAVSGRSPRAVGSSGTRPEDSAAWRRPRWGGFLDDVAGRRGFFEISPGMINGSPAAAVAGGHHEALENAGITPQIPSPPASASSPGLPRRVRDTCGVAVERYDAWSARCAQQMASPPTASYALHQPVATVTTACSSSLRGIWPVRVCVRGVGHRAGGGGQRRVDPGADAEFSMRPSDVAIGRASFLDAAADGFVRSEGAAVVRSNA